MSVPSELNKISGEIVDAAMKVHTKLGPGLLESTYEVCLAYELEKRGFKVERQLVLPVTYEDIEIRKGYRIDLLVDGCLIVELKSVDQLIPIHEAQLLSYLKLSNCRLGLLINFNTRRLKDGIKRMAN